MRPFPRNIVLALFAGLLPAATAGAQSPLTPAAPPKSEPQAAILPSRPNNVTIPRVDRPPVLEDFLDMTPGNGLAGKLATVDVFTQRNPKDGQPASQPTVAYLGYDDNKLYVIFVAFDAEPRKVRAHLTRREAIFDDDVVQIILDTFHDQRRAYFFFCNPLGIQADGIHTEGQGGDTSFDTLWHSRGKLTDRGFVVLMAIPFRSLRFHPAQKDWGIILERRIPRLNEQHYWPRVSSKVEGLLNQGGSMDGLERISPGRNIQLIPYGIYRGFRALDTRDPAMPVFRAENDFDGGLDTKFVLKDRLVVDLTLNPDFSQIESDNPQVTVNQRFEVFFPEKRPFFQENSSFFETPINLLFTRRIADPQFGARVTGKLGKYAIGVLFADDQSPGRSVLPGDPDYGKRAFFGIARVNRDVGKGSTIGFLYTERQFRNAYNRAGGFDTRIKWGKNWVTQAQAVTSDTRFTDGTTQAGPAYEFWTGYQSRKLSFNTLYLDTGGGFLTQSGFFRRPNVRRFSNFLHYEFRPEGKRLINHGVNAFQLNLWDHTGTQLEEFFNANYFFGLARQTEFGVFGNVSREWLRPSDFSALPGRRGYDTRGRGFFFFTSFFPWLSVGTETSFGRTINFQPPSGPPTPARHHFTFFSLTLRPRSQLTIENRYILTRLRVIGADAAIFNNHIMRSKWNYQINRELSIRFIAQYNTTLANGNYSSLANTKSINADFLITYLLHPGTALYAGYNSNAQNLDPNLALDSSGAILRTRSRFINDGRQVFVKFSYLFRR